MQLPLLGRKVTEFTKQVSGGGLLTGPRPHPPVEAAVRAHRQQPAPAKAPAPGPVTAPAPAPRRALRSIRARARQGRAAWWAWFGQDRITVCGVLRAGVLVAAG
ncbi:hypothetical protein [Streptomyces sp. NBC_00539]|uniref:hypothetical protein n=1 Tax=Streptomyces sp. NBC_00539 TaxID=2975770 RepID=UPI002E81E0CA|nr:hypothetical protein [Streptomyces sp. NBC_00539]WUC62780.1 hypothetical protein OG861_00265 [Streptomyces sp. NBC_00539]